MHTPWERRVEVVQARPCESRPAVGVGGTRYLPRTELPGAVHDPIESVGRYIGAMLLVTRSALVRITCRGNSGRRFPSAE